MFERTVLGQLNEQNKLYSSRSAINPILSKIYHKKMYKAPLTEFDSGGEKPQNKSVKKSTQMQWHHIKMWVSNDLSFLESVLGKQSFTQCLNTQLVGQQMETKKKRKTSSGSAIHPISRRKSTKHHSSTSDSQGIQNHQQGVSRKIQWHTHVYDHSFLSRFPVHTLILGQKFYNIMKRFPGGNLGGIEELPVACIASGCENWIIRRWHCKMTLYTCTT